MDYPANDLVVTERAATVSWQLADGARMTTREIAQSSGLQVRGAYRMMNKLARVLSIALDEVGRWHRIDRPLTKRVVRVNPPH